MSAELTYNTLLDFLNERDYGPTVEKGSDQIFINMDIKRRQVPIYFGIRGEGTLLQTLAYLPYELQEKSLGEVARTLHLLNKELDMPGFGMDEKHKVLFYRSVIPYPDGKFDPRLLELYLQTTRRAVEGFMDAIALIIAGATTVDKIMKGK